VVRMSMKQLFFLHSAITDGSEKNGLKENKHPILLKVTIHPKR